MAAPWTTSARVAIVAGKGGVGSSTTAAALALSVARNGADVLLVAVDGKPGIGPLLGGRPLSPTEQVACTLPGGGRVRARTIPPEQAFADYLDLRGVGSILRRAAAAASLDMVAASTPGLQHLLVLGKVKELERAGDADLIVVDCPPAGHAGPFLRSARSLQEVVSSGPARDQADEVSAMLADPSRTQAVLVTLPEETPVNEVAELAGELRESVGLRLGPLVVNCCWEDRPALSVTPATAAKRSGITLSAADKAALRSTNAFGAARLALQRDQLRRLEAAVTLPYLRLPRLPTPRLGRRELEVLADALSADLVGA